MKDGVYNEKSCHLIKNSSNNIIANWEQANFNLTIIDIVHEIGIKKIIFYVIKGKLNCN